MWIYSTQEQTYKFRGRNSHIKTLERHLQAILSTSYQPQGYEELLRAEEVEWRKPGDDEHTFLKEFTLELLDSVLVPAC